MKQNNIDEIDLFYVFKTIKKGFINVVASLFNFLNFCKRNWMILVALLVLGVAYGYFTKSSSKPNKESKFLARINFETVNYVYTQIELFNRKVEEKDTIFLQKIGLKTDTLEIKNIDIDPIINLRDIVDNYGGNSRNLEGLLRNLEFNDKDIEVSNTFTTEYKSHIIHFDLSSNATPETLHKFIDFINANPLIEKIKERGIKNLEERIVNNNIIIKQIDDVIKTYNANKSLDSPSGEIFVVDKNFDIEQILQKKIVLQRDVETAKKELIFSTNILTPISKPVLYKVERSFKSNKLIYYPILFVGLFLMVSFFRHSYFYLKEMVKNREDN